MPSRPSGRRLSPGGGRFNSKKHNKLVVFFAGELENHSQLVLSAPLGPAVLAFYRAAPRIQCLEVFLESLLVFGLQTDEVDSHAKSRIAGAHKGAGRKLLRRNPQVDLETGSDGKRHVCLDITATGANVGGGKTPQCTRPLVLHYYDNKNLVPFPPSAALL